MFVLCLKEQFDYRLFPPIVQPFVALLCNCIYAVIVAFKICPKIEQQHEILSASSFSKDVPNISYTESERHKYVKPFCFFALTLPACDHDFTSGCVRNSGNSDALYTTWQFKQI